MHLARLLSVALFALVSLGLHAGCSQSNRIVRLLEQAHRAYDAGDVDRAEIEYKNVLQKDTQNPEAISRLGLLYYEQGRYGRAVVYLLKARELQPENLSLRQKLALAQLGSSAHADARPEALAILEQRPLDDTAPLVLVSASLTTAEVEDALRRLTALKGPAARSASVLVALGQLALRQNRFADAARLLEEAVAADGQYVAAHSAQGVLRWMNKDSAGADAAFKRAAELSPPRSPQRLHYAQFKRESGDAAAGRQLATELARQAPDYLPPIAWLAELAFTERKFDESAAHVATVLAREPLHPEALLLNAQLKLARGEPAKAVDELERMLSLFPRSPQVAFHLGLAHAAAGDAAKAIGRLTQLTSAAPEFAEAAIALGELHLRKRDYAAALAALTPVTQQRPDALGAQLLLAEAHRGQGNLDEAAKTYADLTRKLPRNPQVAFARGTVLLQQNRLADARREFARANELQPGHLGAIEQLVELDLRDRQPAAARQRVEPALASTPSSAPLAFLLARIASAASDQVALEAALQRTVELDPNHHVAHYQLARLYVDTGREDAAIANLRRVTEASPRSVSPHLLLAVLLDQRRDHAAARDVYEKALTLEPKNTLALNNLACLYLDRFDQPDRALEFAQRARALQPNEPRIGDTLGWALVKKKNYAQAATVLQESAGRLPTEPEVHYHLGVAQYQLGDELAATASLERALSLSSTLAGAADARQRLALLKFDPVTADSAAANLVHQRLASQPDDPIAQLRRADLVRRNGDNTQALAHYKTLLQTNPRHAIALLRVAEIHAEKNDFTRALESAKAARNAAPGNSLITHRVGRIAYLAGDHRWAASLLQEAAKALSENAEVLVDWAEAAYSVGRIPDAEAHLQRALALSPPSPRAAAAQRFLALLPLANDKARASASRSSLQAALAADPHCAPALFGLALADEFDRDLRKAREHYESLLTRFPEFTPAQRNLALLQVAQSGDLAKAAPLLAKARQAFPRDAELTRAAGILAYRQNEFTKAISLLQESATRGTADSEALYYLGLAQISANKRAEGRKTLQRALELGLAEAFATEARKRIAAAD